MRSKLAKRSFSWFYVVEAGLEATVAGPVKGKITFSGRLTQPEVWMAQVIQPS